MKSTIAIYLAGTIKKGHEKADETYWTDQDMALIRTHLEKYEIAFLNPAIRTDNLSDQLSVFNRDMLQVFSSHFVFVDARDRRGLGVGAEMMWAKMNRIPVVTWSPRNSHYNKDHTTLLDVPVTNFIHPFVENLSDKIVENLSEGAEWIDFAINNPGLDIKGIQHIGLSMQHYKKSQLPNDLPMKELLSNVELQQRSERDLPQLVLTS
ncbi:MAG TPA: hypothetical protein VHK67_07550 [Rhabdochlamydiaceae bacterium]|jgi:hypothetical protein|nr:hypothetical protein [Rhabdochlamydiaceae bacterium]